MSNSKKEFVNHQENTETPLEEIVRLQATLSSITVMP